MRSKDQMYMAFAEQISSHSYCSRLKVGAVIVTEAGAVYPGYNGTIAKHYPNVCELASGHTAPWTVHAEANCLDKMAREGVKCEGASLFVTHACCSECSKRLINSGIRRVVYREEYRDTTGLEMLRHCGVAVEKWEDIDG